jgi:hypothetical protein
MNERVKAPFSPVLPKIWKNIVLLEGSQASPACPSHDGSVKVKIKILLQTPVTRIEPVASPHFLSLTTHFGKFSLTKVDACYTTAIPPLTS